MRRVTSLFMAMIVAISLVGGGAMVGPDRTNPAQEGQALAVTTAAVGGAIMFGAGAATGSYLYNRFYDSSNSSELDGADAVETHQTIYDSGLNQKNNQDLTTNSVDNQVQRSKSVALQVAKREYIKQLNNGSSQSVARSQAKQAVNDYYSRIQIRLIKQYEISVQEFNSAYTAAESEPYLAPDGGRAFSESNTTFGYNEDLSSKDDGGDYSYHRMTFGETASETLLNSSSYSYSTFKVTRENTGGNPGIWSNMTVTVMNRNSFSSQGRDLNQVVVKPQDPNTFNSYPLMNTTDYYERFSEIESERDSVNTEVDNFVDTTYGAYTQGEINTSDLVDPYLAASNYSPEDNYGAFTLRSLQALGIDTPDNLSSVGTMTITEESTQATMEGVLLSDGTPSGGSFDINTTYNTSNIEGPQYILDDTNGELFELSGDFTIDSVEDPNGNQLDQNESIDYRQVNYTTTNISELKELNDELQNATAEINARQDQLRGGSGGGGLLNFGSMSMAQKVLLAAALGVAFLLATRQDN